MKQIFRTSIRVLLLLVTGLALGDESLTSIRCDRDIVRLGASKFEVLAQCGEPSDKLIQEQEIIKRDPLSDRSRRSYVMVEHWLYNYGPRRFFKILVFENSRLRAIRQGGYGYDQPDPDFCKSQSNRLDQGEIRPVVRMKCGEPSHVERYYEDRIVKDPETDEEYTITVRVDEWLYNFGSREFMSTLRFEDGVLVALIRGDYGFD